MDLGKSFEALSQELEAVKNRVRNLIDDSHWPTEGKWKEHVLRAVIGRHLSNNINIGEGFILKQDVVIENSRALEKVVCSKQIDIVVYDCSKPVLFKEGNLVIIPPSSVKGIIEVKTRIDNLSNLEEYLRKLADNAEFIRKGSNNDSKQDIFVGLFAFETEFSKNKPKANDDKVLKILDTVSDRNKNRIVNHVSLGKNLFFRYWHNSPFGNNNYQMWHSYLLHERAPGYFINNIIACIYEEHVAENEGLWFPLDGKEHKCLNKKEFRE